MVVGSTLTFLLYVGSVRWSPSCETRETTTLSLDFRGGLRVVHPPPEKGDTLVVTVTCTRSKFLGVLSCHHFQNPKEMTVSGDFVDFYFGP